MAQKGIVGGHEWFLLFTENTQFTFLFQGKKSMLEHGVNTDIFPYVFKLFRVFFNFQFPKAKFLFSLIFLFFGLNEVLNFYSLR